MFRCLLKNLLKINKKYFKDRTNIVQLRCTFSSTSFFYARAEGSTINYFMFCPGWLVCNFFKMHDGCFKLTIWGLQNTKPFLKVKGLSNSPRLHQLYCDMYWKSNCFLSCNCSKKPFPWLSITTNAFYTSRTYYICLHRM